eukprot:g33302.t1
MAYINSSLPACPDPLQFAYRRNRSTEDAISRALHSSLEHLDKKDTYIRLLLVDYSSAFNTIIPSRLIANLHVIGLSSIICNQLSDPRATISEERRLRKFDMSIRSLTNFYKCTIESKLSRCIAAWYVNSSAQDRKTTEGSVHSPDHHRSQPYIHGHHLHGSLPRKGSQHHQRPIALVMTSYNLFHQGE